MYFQDLSAEQLLKVRDTLKQDPGVVPPGLSPDEQDEVVDDWMNRNNTTRTVLACLKRAYQA